MNKEEYERRLLGGTKVDMSTTKKEGKGEAILIKLGGLTYKTILEKVGLMLHNEGTEVDFDLKQVYLQQGDGAIRNVGRIEYEIHKINRLYTLLQISEPTMYLVSDGKVGREVKRDDITLMQTLRVKRGASIHDYV